MVAVGARDEVVQTDAVAGAHERHALAHALHLAGDLVAEDQRQRAGGGAPGAVVRGRVADAGGAHAHEHVARA